jgi:hypothetical protein
MARYLITDSRIFSKNSAANRKRRNESGKQEGRRVENERGLREFVGRFCETPFKTINTSLQRGACGYSKPKAV